MKHTALPNVRQIVNVSDHVERRLVFEVN
uniref:Uncharacterized protein n=1 Tax=Anguilla anguilla TaxID=7936 RepID=A0A0E9VJN1_ANGAN